MSYNENGFTSLRKKLLLSILLASMAVTGIITSLNYYFQYESRLENLHSTLEHLIDSSNASLSRSLWNLDDQHLRVQANSMVDIRHIVGVVILDEDGKTYYEIKKGLFDNEENLKMTTPLFVEVDNGRKQIGTISLYATKKFIYEQLIDDLLMFLSWQIIKTFLITITMLFIFRYFVTNHLENIVSYLQKLDLSSANPKKLTLERHKQDKDELSYLELSINQMVGRVKELNAKQRETIKEQEKTIYLQKAASINSSRLASLGEMAANIAHEINNPLTILSFCSKKIGWFVEQDEFNKERLSHFSSMISRTILRMVRTVEGLKKLSRDAQNDDATSVSVKEIIQGVNDTCCFSIAYKGINFETSIDDATNEISVNCREVQVSQILVNLLNNSVEAIRKDESPWIKLDVLRESDHLIISVEDSGNGISKEIEHKIFEPFYTTKDIGVGTGLGLSISAKMARENDGELYLDRHGSNTKFVLKLPIIIN